MNVDNSLPVPRDDEGRLTKISVKVPSVGGDVNTGGVYSKTITGIIKFAVRNKFNQQQIF